MCSAHPLQDTLTHRPCSASSTTAVIYKFVELFRYRRLFVRRQRSKWPQKTDVTKTISPQTEGVIELQLKTTVMNSKGPNATHNFMIRSQLCSVKSDPKCKAGALDQFRLHDCILYTCTSSRSRTTSRGPIACQLRALIRTLGRISPSATVLQS